MKRFLTAIAVVLSTVGVLAGCGGTNNSIQTATGATIISISPTVVLFGGPDFTLTLYASPANGFATNTVVEWNGQKLASTPIDTATITATVPAALIAKPGTAFVGTFTPQSGAGMNGLSNSTALIVAGVANPVPTLTSLTPATASVCTSKCSSVTITLAGSNFVPSSTGGSSVVTYTGVSTMQVETAITASKISATQITAVIPGSFLSSPDTNAQINVINPPSAPGCIVSGCPDLGGGNTGNLNGNHTSQIFTVTGSAQAAAAVAEETPALNQDGRYVVFSGQQNGVSQIMLRDTCVGADKDCAPDTKIVSAALDGTAGNAESHTPVISADGRFVAFSSSATNLLESAPKGKQIYMRDTCLGVSVPCKPSLALISTDPEGALNGTDAILPSISSSGRFVAFIAVTPDQTASSAKAAEASASPNSGLRQVFLRDTCFGASNCTPKTTRISLQPGDAPANSAKPAGPALSGLAKQIALADGKTSTSFTHTIPVDDGVFLAIPAEPK
jgi:WD40-like Beta Propeller Repeat